MTLATTAEVFALRQIEDPTPTQVALCQQILDEVEADAALYTRRSLGVVAVTEEKAHHVAQFGPSYVPLSRTPVVAVSSVKVDGAEVYAAASASATWERSGVVLGALPAGVHAVEVSYSGGFAAGLPEVVSVLGVVRRRAARIFGKVADSAVGTDRATLEGYEVSWGDEGFTEGETKILDRVRRRTVSAPVAGGTYGLVARSSTWDL